MGSKESPISASSNQRMSLNLNLYTESDSAPDGKPSMSYAQLFKPMLLHFCKGKDFPPPLFRVDKEERDHPTTFTGYVLVDNVEYAGQPGMPSRLEAEQNAAKQALMHLNSAEVMHFNISYLVHNGGLPRNMLLEYAHRIGLPNPVFSTQKRTVPHSIAYFVTTVIMGEMLFEGPAMATKKDAEMNAATYACAQIMTAMSAKGDASVPPQTPNKT